jgi:hypothetical protein
MSDISDIRVNNIKLEIANLFNTKTSCVMQGARWHPKDTRNEDWFWIVYPYWPQNNTQICIKYLNGKIHPLREIDYERLKQFNQSHPNTLLTDAFSPD